MFHVLGGKVMAVVGMNVRRGGGWEAVQEMDEQCASSCVWGQGLMFRYHPSFIAQRRYRELFKGQQA